MNYDKDLNDETITLYKNDIEVEKEYIDADNILLGSFYFFTCEEDGTYNHYDYKDRVGTVTDINNNSFEFVDIISKSIDTIDFTGVNVWELPNDIICALKFYYSLKIYESFLMILLAL